MIVGSLTNSSLEKSALVAYLHYISFMICFAALVIERKILTENLNRQEVITIAVTDVIYGLAALLLLGSGIFRVVYFGQGSEFYLHNPIFWIKVGIFLSVGGLSLYPTVTYILWSIPLTKGKLPEISQKLVSRLILILNIELVGFASIPLLATLMARGIGLGQ